MTHRYDPPDQFVLPAPINYRDAAAGEPEPIRRGREALLAESAQSRRRRRGRRACGTGSNLVFSPSESWVGVITYYCGRNRPGFGSCPVCVQRRYDQLEQELRREMARQELWCCPIQAQYRRKQTTRFKRAKAVWSSYPVGGDRVIYISSVKDALLDPDAIVQVDEDELFFNPESPIPELVLDLIRHDRLGLLQGTDSKLEKVVRVLAQTPRHKRLSSSRSWGWADAAKACPSCKGGPVMFEQAKYHCRDCNHYWKKEKKGEREVIESPLSQEKAYEFLNRHDGELTRRGPDTSFYRMSTESQEALLELIHDSSEDGTTLPRNLKENGR